MVTLAFAREAEDTTVLVIQMKRKVRHENRHINELGLRSPVEE
jgi:hypothetical protein